eukprot:CAMPEP_0201229314 /NCGR_PEP_ID=MMETSP0852-20130820/850_1 /ASSEMBLY_ACC=CAM_ASM_000632 /TAXON_ID=183588 /ORGANISM="Pseudo-nitzschia fraudulenta, Strain WWA7" /LENGTH=230 /DNA_ID=CAMNT_0047519579 /DNA_START=73 /DNA_END=765 /DNA_ORIENTATION=-
MAGTLAITAVAIGLTAVFWTVGQKVNSVRSYWTKCKSETIDTGEGVKCSSWLGKNNDNENDNIHATWFRVNDVIMGGKSTSELSTDSQKRLVFSGTINTDGGGFASVRTAETCTVAPPPEATAIKLVVEGDGQLWKANLGRSHSLMDSSPTYSHDFLTEKGVVTSHTLPLERFTAQKRGRKVPSAGPIEPSEIAYLGLILSLVTQGGDPNPSFGDGPFRIVLHELEFVSE